MSWHIEAWTKWLIFCRRHFQIHFLDGKFYSGNGGHHLDYCWTQFLTPLFNGLVQERRNSGVLAMELRLSCTNTSICCLMTPSHCLNQCRLIIGEVLWHSRNGNFARNAQDIYLQYEFESYSFNLSLQPYLPGINELISYNNCFRLKLIRPCPRCSGYRNLRWRR